MRYQCQPDEDLRTRFLCHGPNIAKHSLALIILGIMRDNGFESRLVRRRQLFLLLILPICRKLISLNPRGMIFDVFFINMFSFEFISS